MDTGQRFCPNSSEARSADLGTTAFQSAQGLYSDIFGAAEVISVDPLRCVSIRKLRSRTLTKWGIQMMKNTILGQSNVDSFVQGFVSTGKFAVLVRVPEEEEELLANHFIEEGKSLPVAKSMASSGPWWHVVDGGHVHGGLVLAILEFSEKFGGFKWPVVTISWQAEEKIRAISRMCNEMQNEGHVIDFTLPDAMSNLREIMDTHSKRQGLALIPGQKVRTGFIKEVMSIYSGSSGFSDNTMRSVCGFVVKLTTSVVEGIRLLLTEECEEYWTSLGSNRPFGQDTRVYKKLLSSQSLKGVKTFLTHEAMADEDRLNVIHRLRFLARERETFKAFSSAEIERQCRCIIEARAKVLRFEQFLGGDPWPCEMENLKRNMLRTTLFDGDISGHVGSGSELLGCMVDAYTKATGTHGIQKLALFSRVIGDEGTRGSEIGNNDASCRPERYRTDICRTDGDASTRGDGTATGNELQDRVIKNNLDEVSNRETENETQDPNLPLEGCGVHVYSQTLFDFERQCLDLGRAVDTGGTFDFIICDPFQRVPTDEEQEHQDQSDLEALVDEKGISLYVQCLRRLLVRGGYCFLFLDWTQMQQWNTCCMKSQFEVLSPFIIAKDPRRVQRMTLKALQCMYDSALVLRKPGKHPSDFKINKTSPYEHLPGCRMPRWTNMIDAVPPPAQRLTFKPSRALVRPNERPCELYIELFETFCPENGRIMDPRAGTLTTGLASLATNRKCVLLESDERCLSFAMPRLRECAKAKLNEEISASVLAEGIRFKEEDELNGTMTEEEETDSLSDGGTYDGPHSPHIVLNRKEGEARVRNDDVMYTSPMKIGSRGSKAFSDLTPEGTPPCEEGLYGNGELHGDEELHSDLEAKKPISSKRNRMKQVSRVYHRDGGSPTSFRRPKRSRN